MSPDRWVVILAFIDLYIHETENKRNSVPHTQKPPPPKLNKTKNPISGTKHNDKQIR